MYNIPAFYKLSETLDFSSAPVGAWSHPSTGGYINIEKYRDEGEEYSYITDMEIRNGNELWIGQSQSGLEAVYANGEWINDDYRYWWWIDTRDFDGYDEWADFFDANTEEIAVDDGGPEYTGEYIPDVGYAAIDTGHNIADEIDVYIDGEFHETVEKSGWGEVAYFFPVSGTHTYTTAGRCTSLADVSESEESYELEITYPGTKLTTPEVTTEPYLSYLIIEWDAVTNATAYEIYKDGNLLATQTATQRALTDSGSYYVVAIADGYTDSDPSETIVYSRDPLPAPVLSINGDVLSWTNVVGAENYNVYKDGVFVTTVTARTYTVTQGGIYKVNANAEGHDAGYFSNEVVYQVQPLAAPILTLSPYSPSFKKLEWTEVEGTELYFVYRNGVKVDQREETELVISQYGVYTIKAWSTEKGEGLESNTVVWRNRETYLVYSDDLTDIANALREKSGETGNLSFPDDFIRIINSL